MACRPIPEIEADLETLRSAYLRLLTGKSVKSFTIGSDDLQRRYSYSEINAKLLKLEIARVEQELAECSEGVPTTRFDYTRRHNIVVTRNV